MTTSPASRLPPPNMLAITHLIYGLHAFAVVSAILGSATIVFSFIASLPSIVAVILNYWNQRAVRDSWLESHFRWQIRSFWFAVLWVLIAVLMMLTVVGLPFAFIVLLVLGLWISYRIARGWWVLLDQRPMPLPPGD